MKTRIMISLGSKERDALIKNAEQEMRPLREQVRYILIREMKRLGLLAEVSKSSSRLDKNFMEDTP